MIHRLGRLVLTSWSYMLAMWWLGRLVLTSWRYMVAMWLIGRLVFTSWSFVMAVWWLGRLVLTCWRYIMIMLMIGSKTMFGRWRSNQSCRFPKVWFFLCFVLEDIRRKWGPIADPVTVSEIPVVPFFLRG